MNKRLDNMDIPEVYGPPPIDEEEIQKMQANLYGPPPVSREISKEPIKTLYGPSPVSRKKKSPWGVIIFVISVILGGLIYYGYKMISTVYGPPSVDVRHDFEPDVYGLPPISVDKRQEMIPKSPMKEDTLYESHVVRLNNLCDYG